MIILNVDKVSKSFGYGVLFENISFSLNEGEAISIVGPNGCGKSTLLKMIAGKEKVDSGFINIKKNAKVAYLDQVGSSINDERSVYEFLKDAFADLNDMHKRLKNLENQMNTEVDENEQNKLMIRYCNLIEKFSLNGGYDIDININTVIDGLKIDRSILNKSFNNLSGGEKTLVQLAKALLIKPDLFLLDEPTNHLDIERIEWLEDYIKSFKGAIVIVSHDRYFLDKMSTKILNIDNGKGKIYFANYTKFVEEKQKNFEKQMNDYKLQQNTIKRLEEQIKYFSERGMATNSSSLCDRAHALQTQLDRIKKSAIQKPREQKKINLDFNELKKSSKRVIEIKNLTIKIDENNYILKNVDLHVCVGERVAFIGSNGSGKTSLVKVILQKDNLPFVGDVFIGSSVKIGYLPQIINFPNGEMKLLDYFIDQSGLSEKVARQILSSFQFYKEDVNKRVKNLSGGERVRVKLAELLQHQINTLIFDEPTNHIDLETKEVLEKAISNFDGTFIFISHDRYFINKFADRVIEFKDKNLKSYLGGYDDYKNEKIKERLKN